MDNHVEKILSAAIDQYIAYVYSEWSHRLDNNRRKLFGAGVTTNIFSALGSSATMITTKIQENPITEDNALRYGFMPRSEKDKSFDTVDGNWYFVPNFIIILCSMQQFPLVYRNYGEEKLRIAGESKLDVDKLFEIAPDIKISLVQFDEKGYMMKTKEDYEAFEKRKTMREAEKANLTLKFAQDNNYPALTLNEEFFYSPTGIGYVLPDDVVERLRDDDTIYGHDLTLSTDIIRSIRKAEYKDNRYRFVVEFNSDGSLVSREQYKKYMNSRYGEGRSPVKSMVSPSKPKVKPSIRKRAK